MLAGHVAIGDLKREVRIFTVTLYVGRINLPDKVWQDDLIRGLICGGRQILKIPPTENASYHKGHNDDSCHDALDDIGSARTVFGAHIFFFVLVVVVILLRRCVLLHVAVNIRRGARIRAVYPARRSGTQFPGRGGSAPRPPHIRAEGKALRRVFLHGVHRNLFEALRNGRVMREGGVGSACICMMATETALSATNGADP